MKKILVIEDNADVRENTVDMLELANYDVAFAENGKIGVEKATIILPDVIVCDIMMPELDGYGVLDVLGKNEKTAGIPFIFLTAKSEKADRRRGMNLGADDYLTKPFEEHELLEAVASRLRKNDFLRKKFSTNREGITEFLDEASKYLNLESISRDYRPREYKNKDFIFKEGEPANTLYLIESGIVKLYRSTEAGKELVTGIYQAGDYMGQLSLLGYSSTYLNTAMVLKDATVFAIPKATFIPLIYGNHVIAQKFLGIISNDLREVHEQLTDIAYATVRQRVAKALLALHGKGLIMDGQDDGIDMPREDLAGLIGTAKETAIRTLSDFKGEGLIATGQGRRIILRDKEALRRVAEFG